ncbi:MAG: single-stranded DNA-binding protein [Clostridiales bacterium]|nr:single-stranded DNA-binding protein [Clostridiales bacterium]
MNNTTSIQNNKGKLQGKILQSPQRSFEVEGELFFEGQIVTQRLSDANDILPFTISEKLLKTYNIKLESGVDVCFGGELRSYNKVIDGKSRLILSFFVKEILPEEDFVDNSNQLSLTGFICKTPVFRTTPFNRQICDILLAVNRPSFNKSDYIPCILWGRNAKFIQGQKVGTKIELTGRMQSRMYRKEVSQGIFEQRTAYEVSCQKINVLSESQHQSQNLA